MRTAFGRLSSLWLMDFEFTTKPGEPPVPLCVVAHEIVSGRWVRRWLDDHPRPRPLDLGPNAALVAYLASAEVGCYLALGWPLPAMVIDLFVEHKNATNGLPVFKHGVLDALRWHGVTHGIDELEKGEMRQLAMRGGPYTPDEKAALLAYCETDVVALTNLLPVMLPSLDIDRTLLRGRYMVEVAKMEAVGVRVDAERLDKFLHRWDDIQQQIGRLANLRYENVFRRGRSFSQGRFEGYLNRRGILWPRLDSGKLDLKDDTFSDMVKLRPELQQLRDARKILSRLRLNAFTVGADGRNRAMLSPFRSKTGRNQPSNSRFLIGASAWLRFFIKPAEGRAVAYIDYSQQEFAVAAALSEDARMLADYESGDPYLRLAIRFGAAPADATSATHGPVRETYKVVMLAVLYGMGALSLARDLDIQLANAEGLIRQIQKAYPEYWAWSSRVASRAHRTRRQRTCFGWEIRYPTLSATDTIEHRRLIAKQDRTARNWPVQATGAEILRVAVILAGQRDIRVCAPVHDAVLIESTASNINEDTRVMRQCMVDAGVAVASVRLRTTAEVVEWPGRYRDKKGAETWEQLCKILNLDP